MKSLAIVLLTLFVLTPLTATAHTLEAPDEVTADPAGDFTIPAAFRVGPGSADLAATSWMGTINVTDGQVADCFCLPSCTLPEGTTLDISWASTLDDPSMPGLVTIEVALCSGGLFTKDVIVRPFVVSTETVNWSAIKARFQ